MMVAFLSLPMLLGCLIVMALTTAVGLSVYVLFHRLLAKNCAADDVKEMKDATGNLFRVVGWLFSLLISLTFAELFREWVAIDTAIEGEAVAILDTHKDLQLFDPDATGDIRKLLIDYTRAVSDDDWPALADDRLSPRVDALLLQLNQAVFNLETNNAAQEALQSRIVADLDLLSDFRLSRLQQAQKQIPFVLIVVLLGFLITMACFAAYRPNRSVVVLLSLFTMFVGIVIYLMLAMSDPFQGELSIDSTPLDYALDRLEDNGG